MNEPPAVQLCFVPTKAEIEELTERLTLAAYGGSTWKALGCMVLPVLIGFVSLAFRLGVDNVGYLIAAIVVITIVITVLKKRSAAGGEEVIVEIDAHGIHLGTGKNRTFLKSSTINKLIESDTMLIVVANELGLMLPKRVFESDADLEFVREQFVAWAAENDQPQDDATDNEPDDTSANDGISVKFKLGFRDHVSKQFVSWVPRLICAVIVCLSAGAFIAALANPPADAVFTALETFVYFFIPFTAFMCIVVVSVVCVMGYLQVAGMLLETQVVLSRKGLRCKDSKYDSTIEWSTPTRFKESSKLICIWWPGSQGWLMIPKRAFESDAHRRAFLAELATRAEESPWLWRY